MVFQAQSIRICDNQLWTHSKQMHGVQYINLYNGRREVYLDQGQTQYNAKGIVPFPCHVNINYCMPVYHS